MPEKPKGVKFTSPLEGRPYTGGIYFKDGEVKEIGKGIPYDKAAELVRRLPDRFTWIKAEKKAAKPKFDKSMKAKSDK